jgi:hypothetical protein
MPSRPRAQDNASYKSTKVVLSQLPPLVRLAAEKAQETNF